MNNANYTVNDPEELTVAEYAKRFGISENTIRTRINRKKLKTIKGIRDGRETILILVEPSEDHSFQEYESSETVQDAYFEQSEQPNQLFDFMRDTLSTVQGYTSQIVELSRENERYKLITDNTTRTAENLEQTVEQLKGQLFEKEAKIKELELQEPNHELSARIKELEALLEQKESQISSLKAELEAERAKGILPRLFGR